MRGLFRVWHVPHDKQHQLDCEQRLQQPRQLLRRRRQALRDGTADAAEAEDDVDMGGPATWAVLAALHRGSVASKAYVISRAFCRPPPARVLRPADAPAPEPPPQILEDVEYIEPSFDIRLLKRKLLDENAVLKAEVAEGEDEVGSAKRQARGPAIARAAARGSRSSAERQTTWPAIALAAT